MNNINRRHPLPRNIARARQGQFIKFAVVAVLALAGAGGFIWASHRVSQVVSSPKSNGRPAAYQNSDYYSPEFLAEQQKISGIWQTSGTLVGPANFHGRWFNTQQGRRITFGQPPVSSAAVHTVWLVGGSAVFDGAVPDAFTFASQLQNLANQNDATKGQWKIENLGANGVQATQEAARLQTLPVKAGDIVLVYDGAEDALHGGAKLDDTISTYGNALNDAARYTRAKGARFVHILQPMLFTQPMLSASEKQIAAALPAGQENALRTAYAQFQKALPQLAVMNKWQYADFGPVLNGPDNYYLDCCTTTEHAGALVAGHLFQILFQPPLVTGAASPTVVQ